MRIYTLKKTSKTYTICINAAGTKQPIYKKFSKFSLIKRFKENGLFFCNEILFYFFVQMENIFQLSLFRM